MSAGNNTPKREGPDIDRWTTKTTIFQWTEQQENAGHAETRGYGKKTKLAMKSTLRSALRVVTRFQMRKARLASLEGWLNIFWHKLGERRRDFMANLGQNSAVVDGLRLKNR
ncbi:hypothetical protein Aduo_014679 [Ancylostoma duodenale]